MTVIACVLTAYLVGAIPSGYLIARFKGTDIRTQGSGNVGATNVGRVLGRRYGYLVFALDVLKGFLPTLIAARVLLPAEPVAPGYLLALTGVAVACILGHVFPVYLGFKGGKGVATSLGVLLGVYPYFTLAGVLVLGVWIVLTLTTRYVSVGSVGAAVAFPLVFAVLARFKAPTWGGAGQLWPLYVFSAVVAALVVYRHRANLQRLWQGVEPQIRSGSSRSSVEVSGP